MSWWFWWFIFMTVCVYYHFKLNKNDDLNKNDENYELNEGLNLLIDQIDNALTRCSLIRGFHYNIKFRDHSDENYGDIVISFNDQSCNPTQLTYPVSTIPYVDGQIFECLGNKALKYEISSIYTKPYLRFDCTDEKYKGFYVKVYFVHSAWGWIKVIGDAFEKGQQKGKDWGKWN